MQPNQAVFEHLTPAIRDLCEVSWQLLEREEQLHSQLHDYSFVVFPMAKAYEGYLKEYLLTVGLINKETYLSRKFRIGRALNPDVNQRQQDELWLYDDLSRSCGDELARQVWQTWLDCRNHVFHFFPERNENLTLQQARECLTILTTTMQAVWVCQTQTEKP